MQNSVLCRFISPSRLIRHTLEKTGTGIKILIIEHKNRFHIRTIGDEMCNVILHKMLSAHRVTRHGQTFLQQRIHIELPIFGSPYSKSLIASQQISVRHVCRFIIVKHMRGTQYLEEVAQIPLLLHHLKKGLVGHRAAFITIMFVPRIGTSRSC